MGDAILALIEARCTTLWCHETKGLRYSDFNVDDLSYLHVDGSHFGSFQYVTVYQRKTSSTPVFMIGWRGDEAPHVIFYVDGPWLSRLADLTHYREPLSDIRLSPTGRNRASAS